MKLFRRLDNYLLHHYPSVWITRAHVFLPIGFAIIVILAGGNILSGWNPKEDIPHEGALAILLLIIPVIIYVVYWFIFQSRYNVMKSGGKMSIGLEYMNFFLYMLVAYVAFLIIIAVPLSNSSRIRYAVPEEELVKDVFDLNMGYAFFSSSDSVIFNPNGTLNYQPQAMLADYFTDGQEIPDNYPLYDFPSRERKTITETEAIQLIDAFITAHNKYTDYEITVTPEERLNELRPNQSGLHGYYPIEWSISYKISMLRGLYGYNSHFFYYSEYEDAWFWKTAFAFFGMFALLVWIFKQMKLRQFIFGFIAICLTPLVMGIIGVVLFGLLGYNGDEDVLSLGLILIAYVAAAVLSLGAFGKKALNKTGYVATMYLQFFLPFLPLMLTLFFSSGDRYWPSGRGEEILYWVSWIAGLLSILTFKPMYRKFYHLPERT